MIENTPFKIDLPKDAAGAPSVVMAFAEQIKKELTVYSAIITGRKLFKRHCGLRMWEVQVCYIPHGLLYSSHCSYSVCSQCGTSRRDWFTMSGFGTDL